MKTRTLLVAAVLVAVIVAGAEAGMSGQKRHKLEMTWTVAKVDAGFSPRFQLDRFTATGKPFGKSEATTTTKESELEDDRKHPRFEIEKFKPESRKGWVRGSLIVDRRYLRTTKAFQKIEYDGQGAIEAGSSRSIYRGAVGRITDFYGIVTCYTKSKRCTGSIKVTGYVYY